MTTDTKVADLPAKWRAKAKRIRGITAGSDFAADIMEGSAEDLEAALARQEADKTKAAIWIEFAENGNIRFWTSDQDRAIEESFCHARRLTAYYAAPPAAQAVDLEQLRRALCVIGEVGEIDGHGVIRRNSMLEIVGRFIDQQAGKGGA